MINITTPGNLPPQGIEGDPDHSLIPLTIPQRNVWLECLRSGIDSYVLRYVFEIIGPLDPEKFETAIKETVMKYDAFRTVIVEREWTPFQIIAKKWEWERAIIRFDQWTKEEIQDLLREGLNKRARIDYQHPFVFALAKGPDEVYYLLFAYHHIIVDGNSLKRVFSEISAHYNTRDTFKDPQRQENPEIHTVQSWDAGLDPLSIDQGHHFWKNYLSSSLLDLPFPEKEMNTEKAGRSEDFYLSLDLSEMIRDFACVKGFSVFQIMLAAFGILLHKFLGEDDFTIFYYANIRPGNLEKAICHFVGMQPWRCMISGDITFQRFLKSLSEELKIRRTNGLLPFPFCLGTTDRLQYGNIGFGKTISGRHFLELDQTVIQSHRFKGIPGEHDLLLMYDDDEDQIHFYLEYKSSIPQKAMTVFLSRFEVLLRSILEQPDAKLSSHSLLNPAEKEHLLNTWCKPIIRDISAGTVIDWFRTQVLHHSGSTAIIFENDHLTYQQLNEKAHKLASCLVGMGAGPEKNVPFCIEQSILRIVSLVAIAMTGACYIPIEPGYPRNRSQFILQDTASIILVTSEKLDSKFDWFKGRKLLVDKALSEDAIGPVPDLTNQTPVDPDDPAYILYTSGTTGTPKGVVIHHAALANFVCEYSRLLQLNSRSRVLQFTSICFDISGMEIWCTLCSGATLVLYPDNRMTGFALLEFMVMKKITHGILSSTVLGSLPPPKDDLDWNVEMLMFIGETCPLYIQERWSGRVKLFNGYGPTETTICVNRYRSNGQFPPDTIGRPLINTGMYLLDNNLQPLPPYVTGELYISGIQVSKGYLNQPDLTREKFIENPYASDYEKMKGWTQFYKTGDMARFLPDGNIEYLGRKDQQVKVRGFRIELGEIEQAIILQGFAEQVYVNIITLGAEKHIVAYLVHKDGRIDESHSADISRDCRESLKDVLPGYMIPRYFVWLDNFPLTDNGKLNKRAFPLPGVNTDKRPALAMSVGNNIEKVLAELWRQLLHREDISPHDKFFDIGGNSLLVTEMYTRLPEEYKIRISLPDLFSYNTIKSIAELIGKPDIN